MALLKNLGNLFSALATGAVCGAIAYFTLSYFFPPEPFAKISYVAFLGGLLGFTIGVYTGWRWAQNIAESLLIEILEKVTLRVIALVAKEL